MNTVHQWLNLVLALLGSLAAFGVLNKMRAGETRPCMIAAVLLIAIGLAGQWLGIGYDRWLPYVDTALYGGVLALLIASQRVHTWFLERWANPVASIIASIAAAVLLAGLLGGCTAVPPPCAKLEAMVINSNAGPLVAFDMENLGRLAQRELDIQDGKCRVERPSAPLPGGAAT